MARGLARLLTSILESNFEILFYLEPSYKVRMKFLIKGVLGLGLGSKARAPVVVHLQVAPLGVDDHLLTRRALPLGHAAALLEVGCVGARAEDQAHSRGAVLVRSGLHGAHCIVGEGRHLDGVRVRLVLGFG